jgi:hypothetical protein
MTLSFQSSGQTPEQLGSMRGKHQLQNQRRRRIDQISVERLLMRVASPTSIGSVNRLMFDSIDNRIVPEMFCVGQMFLAARHLACEGA